ncbi:MAG: HEAT repeat domain-containing protein [Desulfobulbus sp.]|nr:HEAT repeat domain-containing protein [Desulfobulbus sp.]
MPQNRTPRPRDAVSDAELMTVIADFLALGHVDNIIAMIRQEPRYLAWLGSLLEDERYSVRIGVLVLLEELRHLRSDVLPLAVPGLISQLQHPIDWVRGEAASALGIIGSAEALTALRPLLSDSSAQVVEIVQDILEGSRHG